MEKEVKSKMRKVDLKGFTLIELLIVVAIIAILAAIAIPNFLDAQVRAKVARAQSDMRNLTTALESYVTDQNVYPPFFPVNPAPWDCDGGPTVVNPCSCRFIPLTTPIKYFSSAPPEDPFWDTRSAYYYDNYDYIDAYSFALHNRANPSGRVRGAVWRLCSAGPDRYMTFGGPSTFNLPDNPGHDYDPTNGTVSNGDIIRVGARSSYPGNCMYPDQVDPCY